MLPQRLYVTGGLGLAAALTVWAWPFAPDAAVHVASGKSFAQTVSPSAAPPASFAVSVPATTPAAALPAAPLAAPRPAQGAAAFVPISVTAPQRLDVGEVNELVIGVAANVAVGGIGLTIQFDPNVLQVRAATEGDWAAGAGLPARFTAEISSAEDRVQIRAEAPGRRLGGAAVGSVAIVQVQAMAPGSTSVIISDVVLTDLAGRPLAAALSASNLQLTVDSAAAGLRR